MEENRTSKFVPSERPPYAVASGMTKSRSTCVLNLRECTVTHFVANPGEQLNPARVAKAKIPTPPQTDLCIILACNVSTVRKTLLFSYAKRFIVREFRLELHETFLTLVSTLEPGTNPNIATKILCQRHEKSLLSGLDQHNGKRKLTTSCVQKESYLYLPLLAIYRYAPRSGMLNPLPWTYCPDLCFSSQSNHVNHRTESGPLAFDTRGNYSGEEEDYFKICQYYCIQ